MLVYDLDLPSLIELVESWDQPSYRANQIWEGIYRHYKNSPEEFSNLPLNLRERIKTELGTEGLKPLRTLSSADGKTLKTLFALSDGNVIETVLMCYDKRRTVCISTQVGCAMGCVFCATGQMGFKRNMTSGEIIVQVIYFARYLQTKRKKVTNVVLMGMGEPFHNYENTMTAIDRLNDPGGFALGARRFTISTVGLVPQIIRFADEKRQVNLAVSLHSASNESRSAMLPVNKRWTIEQIIDACRYYVQQTGRRVTFEWALIQGVNDTPEMAGTLADRLQGLLCHVNAIPLNPTTGFSGIAASKDRADRFKACLEQAGIPCTIRVRRGLDIQAGCGQLASSVFLQEHEDYSIVSR